jgi:hypothetical protein
VLELMRAQQAQRGAAGRVRWEEENDQVAHILIIEHDHRRTGAVMIAGFLIGCG